MTVSSEINRKDYAGNGSTTEFATEFRFLVDTSIKVIVTDTAGVETDQTLTTDYTVTGVGDDSGGTVTMIAPPASGETLTIKRDGPITQLTDYVENDDFPAESHERALDKLTMLQQQQQEEIDRSLKISEGQVSSGLTVPAPVTGQFLQWDASGNFINVDIADQGLLVVTPFGETLVAAADAAAGRVIMESAKKVSSAVTDNITTFDADDEAKDSGISIDRVVQIADAAGTADVITAAFTPAITALTKGLEVRVRALLANATTTPTINYNGLGAKTIVKVGNQPLGIGDIANLNHELQLVYNLGNDNVELLNPAGSSGSLSADNFLHIQDQKTSGTTGGASVAGLQKRTLNTVLTNTIAGSSLSSNEITLQEGVYIIKASAPCRQGNGHQVQIKNETDVSVILNGTSELLGSSVGATCRSFVSGTINIVGVKNISLTHYITSVYSQGLGNAAASGQVEIYAEIEIWKVG